MGKAALRVSRLLLCLAAAVTGPSQENIRDSGPTNLVITYRCAPAQRVQLRQHMRTSGLRQFQQWKQAGVLADYHLLFSRYVDSDGWDMMSILTFSRYSDVDKWNRVEWTTPAGLSADALALTIAVNSYPVDLTRQNTAEGTTTQPVFLVIAQTRSVPTSEYLAYVDEYLKPQFDGWLEEGVLARYGVYQQRYEAARPWDSLILLEYKSEEALGQREKVAAAVRDRLRSNPGWQARGDNEQNVRTERQAVVADEVSVSR